MNKDLKKKRNYYDINKPSQPIPIFGYKSSFFILFWFIVILFSIPNIFKIFCSNCRIVSAIISSILMGFVVCYAQFFVQNKKGFTRSFFVIWFCLAILFLIMLLFNFSSFM